MPAEENSEQAVAQVPAPNTYVQLIGPPRPPEPSEKEEFFRGKPDEKRTVAVLVTHGMGSQVPFETLELITNRLLPFAVRHPATGMAVKVGLVTLGKTQLPRGEITIHDGQGGHIDVHLYEAYWAPLTEGKVTARDAMWFLFMAGWRGFCASLTASRFQRWMFGEWQEFPFQPLLLGLVFALGLAVLSSFFLMNLAIAALTVVQSQRPAPLLPIVANEILPYEILAFVLLGLGIGIPMLVRSLIARLGWPAWLGRWMRWPARLLVFLTIGVTIWMGSRVGWDLGRWWMGKLSAPTQPLAIDGILAFALLLAIAIAYVARWFLREYVGDVAAYVSSYSVSKFEDLRNAIQKAALDVFQPVYEEKVEPEHFKRKRNDHAEKGHHPPEPEMEFLYKEIVAVGHSLGSVIAYDTVNELINLPSETPTLDAATRTKAMLTFGSPLDKTAFIFRLQRPRRNAVREALAAAKQPLVQDYVFRPRRWVNLYSPDDWISGSLEYYDPDGKPDPVTGILAPSHTPDPDKRIHNFVDPDAYIPFAAHVAYWTTEAFTQQLYQAVIS